MPPLPRSGRVAVVNDAPFIQMEDMVSCREIVVIMRDDDQRSPRRFQFRQDFSIENMAENRVLIGCPLVQHQDWPVFDQRLHQRQTPALSGGKAGGAETALLQPDLGARPSRSIQYAARARVRSSGCGRLSNRK